MNNIEKKVLEDVQFYVTTKYSCVYIDGRDAQSLVATPYKNVNTKNFNSLISQGFRRSGQYVYKPSCKDCSACIPIRLLASSFTPSRSQKRVKKYLDKLSVKLLPLTFDEEHYNLYVSYQNIRHRTNDVNEDSLADYNNFLVKSNVNSKLVEFRLNNQLKMVTIIDIIEDGISAVYTFYDCSDRKLSLGTISVIWLLDLCKKERFLFLYLGYWIYESQKMKYKTNFKPYELMIEGVWQEGPTK
ncbi:arginyltransferase [Methylophilaceae bacterium]|jgi:leucyl-tRNA---protein transferase|nr:arginyltransferase [Methylophilaceae bacterium]|tara:strand:+ start:7383 stop:8111 length:729 start_codon:yes stop_codon:yes gene_type:complete